MPTAKKDKTTLVNPNTAGVVYDEAGHSLGGGESVVVDSLDKVGKAALATGQLLCRNDD